jgi:hypothetical protein
MAKIDLSDPINLPQQVKISEAQLMSVYTMEDDIEPAYAAALETVNKLFLKVPHHLKTTARLIDPALAVLARNHVQSTCRLEHDIHDLHECIAVQAQIWFQRMYQLAEREKIKMPEISEQKILDLQHALAARAIRIIKHAEEVEALAAANPNQQEEKASAEAE